MPNLRIALGYKTEHRKSEPAVLAAGFDQTAIQHAVDTAPADFQRFEIGSFFFGRRGRRNAGAVPAEAPEFPIAGPTDADALAMLAEIEKLHAALADERVKAQALLASALGEIERLKLQIEDGRAQNSTPHAAPVVSSETAEPPAIPAESSDSAEATEGDGPSLTPAPAPSDSTPRKRR